MTEGIDIYDETGHVDTKFLMEALSCVNTFVNASNIVVQKISSLLAPDASTDEKKKQADEGKKWNVEEILKHCTLENNILKLPQVQFNKKSYAEAKKVDRRSRRLMARWEDTGFHISFLIRNVCSPS